MKKLHSGSKNQNVAFNMSCVDKKDAPTQEFAGDTSYIFILPCLDLAGDIGHPTYSKQ